MRCHAQRSQAQSPSEGVDMAAGVHCCSLLIVSTHADQRRPCKNRKIKCGEEKPQCLNCVRQGDTCDYSIRLNWFRSDVSHQAPSQPRPPLSTRSSSDGEYARINGKETTESTPGQATSASPPRKTFSPSRPSLEGRHSYGSEESHTESSGYNGGLGLPVNSPAHPVFTFQGTPPDPTISDAQGQSQASTPGDPPLPIPSGSFTQPAGYRDQMSANQLSRFRDYPSPAESNIENSSIESPPFLSAPYQAQMPPPPHQPLLSHSPYGLLPRRYPDEGQAAAAEHQSKRIRFSPSFDLSSDGLSRLQNMAYGNAMNSVLHKPTVSPAIPNGILHSPSRFPGTLPTPAASTTSEEFNSSSSSKPSAVTENPDLRRLSVKSLLSDDFDQPDSGESVPPPLPLNLSIDYGVDRGFPDLDLPKNNDALALNGITPSLSSPGLCRHGSTGLGDEIDAPIEFGFGIHSVNHAHAEGGYYANPVTVSIPKSLGDLPPTLRDNPMNLLYFHHFLNHTARILVPHDCVENPFRSILPQMALQEINLLHLLLAYSASHRARLLKHPEPANRIALWVQDIFPALSRALNDPSSQISNANLATAIMLASLEIISPNTFEVPIPWQSHLNVARRMLMARGGAKSIHRKDVVSYFLSRWFAYLDVVGSLSGGKKDQPLFSGDFWADDDLDGEDGFQIDCLTGFTSRCVGILARIAELAKQCDSERIDSDGAVIDDWEPSPHIAAVAKELKAGLMEARTHKYKGCPHRNTSEAEAVWDSIEMVATNETFHWAGLIHLHRRVLRKPAYDSEVQTAVREIVIALDRVRKGGTAEACLLFPMFTAGCQAKEDWMREKLLQRLKSVEGSGMTQVFDTCFLLTSVYIG